MVQTNIVDLVMPKLGESIMEATMIYRICGINGINTFDYLNIARKLKVKNNE